MWDRCWAAARVRLRLSSEEFFSLTPRQLRVLIDEHRAAQQHTELLFGLLTATVGNHGFAQPKKPYVPADFMPSQWGKPKKKRVRRMSRDQVADNVRAMFDALMRKQNANPN